MSLVVIAHNIRSTHNVGAIFRTCDGFGIERLYLTGYTPYPTEANDSRLPHLREKLTKQIHKTSLGAEQTVPFNYFEDPLPILKRYHSQGFTLAALEQASNAIQLQNFTSPDKLVLLLGEEVHGITQDLLQLCDVTLEIPMVGHKESFNVSVATGIALYALTFGQKS